MVLQRWDPFRELQRMESTMDRLWRGFGFGDVFEYGAGPTRPNGYAAGTTLSTWCSRSRSGSAETGES